MDTEATEIRTRLEGLLKTLGTRDVVVVEVDGKMVRSIRLELESGQMRAILPFRFSGDVTPRAKYGDLPEAIRGALATRAKGDAAESDGTCMVSGTASSTSVDWYGTEMSLPCLDDMAAQFRAGVDLTPRHGGWFTPLEWDDVMGRTIMASVVRGDVVDPAVATDPQFKLEVTSECDGSLDKVKSLCKRLENKQAIGMSIGGWFRDIQYVINDEDGLERIIVHRVELDHLAVVRSPANPDCTDLKVMRSVAQDALKGRHRADLAPAAAPSAPPSAGSEPVPAARSTDTPAPTPVVPAPDARAACKCDRAEGDCGPDCACGCKCEGKDCTCDCSCHGDRAAPTPGGHSHTHEEGGNRDAVTSPPVLDTTPATRNDGGTDAPGAPAADDSTPHEDTMTPEQLRAILDEKLAPLTARLDAVEARSTTTPAPAPAAAAPAPAPAATGDADLRARITALEGQVRNRDEAINALAERGVRSGMGQVVTVNGDAMYGESTFESLLGRCKSEDKSPALTAVVTRHKALLTVDLRAKGGDKGAKVREACEAGPDLLRSILNSAEADGTLDTWKASA